ncbi:hypothetical protein ACLHDG_05155 [Sulfurovum sp. CS9]|uniref:hypothetical protein n=1 Tax=Sulfurovum sp. CS9 TaxID=3391146 RepID=UPI0039ED3C07
MVYDIWKLKNKMIGTFFLLMLLLVIPSSYLCATPAKRIQLPDPVTAYITFPASRSPDSNGNFEVEIYCESHYDIESIKILIGHSEEIVFNKKFPTFSGKMKAGERKLWRITGQIKKNTEFNGTLMPASISVGIEYLYPYNTMLKHIEKVFRKGSRDNSITKQYMKKDYLERLEELKGRKIHIIKALPVWKAKRGI